MNAAFWLRPVLSCRFVWNAVFGAMRERSTTGGQDKRPGTLGRYGFGIVGFFAHFRNIYSAACQPSRLTSLGFRRAVPFSELVQP